jgi:hypothetical protein
MSAGAIIAGLGCKYMAADVGYIDWLYCRSPGLLDIDAIDANAGYLPAMSAIADVFDVTRCC